MIFFSVAPVLILLFWLLMVIVCLVIYFCLVLLAHFDSQMVRSAVDVIIETDAGAGIMLT